MAQRGRDPWVGGFGGFRGGRAAVRGRAAVPPPGRWVDGSRVRRACLRLRSGPAWRPALAGLSSVLLAWAFAPSGPAWLAFVALVPLLAALRGRGPGPAFLLCFAFGIAFSMLHFRWILAISGFTAVHFLILGIYFGCQYGLVGALAASIVGRGASPVLAWPPLWVAMEFIRGHAGFLSLPWAFLAHSQYEHLALIQVASVTGAYGVSFLIVLVNAALAGCLARGRRALPAALLAGGVLGACLAYGGAVLAGAKPAARTFRVAVIQPNIPQEIKWKRGEILHNLERHVTMTRRVAATGRPQLVVWPEASAQGYFVNDPAIQRPVIQAARETGVDLLIGTGQRPKFGDLEFRGSHALNAAYLVGADGRVHGAYRKQRLLPFAEDLPWREWFPWPEGIRRHAGSYVPGKGGEPLVIDAPGGPVRFGVLICWENIFPGLFRRSAAAGVDFMVNITNEGWFGDSAVPYQFLSMSVFRAVEHRIPIVRSANTGISGFIGPEGAVRARVRQGPRDVLVRGDLTWEVPLAPGRTFYTLHGDVFAYGCMGLAGVLLLPWPRVRRRRAG
jgi:apolipoprotein N-acyltransferase